MTPKEARNMVTSHLENYLGLQVYRAGQVAPETKLPCIIYSIISPYIAEPTMGFYDVEREANEAYLHRRERAGMSLSFTACSHSRDENGVYIQGEDEAMEIAEEAQGWFLLSGRSELSLAGIVVEDVNNVQQRNTLMVDEEANRYGFDVLLRYVRDDKMAAGVVEKITVKGKEKNE